MDGFLNQGFKKPNTEKKKVLESSTTVEPAKTENEPDAEIKKKQED
jgi:hypothetical protein